MPTPRGAISVSWERTAPEGRVAGLDLGVPPNAVATVHLGALSADQVTEGSRPVARAPGVVVAAGLVGDTITSANLSKTFGMDLVVGREAGRFTARAS